MWEGPGGQHLTCWAGTTLLCPCWNRHAPQQSSSRRAGTTPTAQDVCAGDSERISRAGAPSGGDGGWVAVPTSLGGSLGHNWTSLTARAQGPAA